MRPKSLFHRCWCLIAAILIIFLRPMSAMAEYVFQSQVHTYRAVTLARGINQPWGMAFLPGNQGILVTEKAGKIRLYGDDLQELGEGDLARAAAVDLRHEALALVEGDAAPVGPEAVVELADVDGPVPTARSATGRTSRAPSSSRSAPRRPARATTRTTSSPSATSSTARTTTTPTTRTRSSGR